MISEICSECGSKNENVDFYCEFCGYQLKNKLNRPQNLQNKYTLMRDQETIDILSFFFQYLSIPVFFLSALLILINKNELYLVGYYLAFISILALILARPIRYRSEQARKGMIILSLISLPFWVSSLFIFYNEISIIFIFLSIGVLYFFNRKNIKIIFKNRILPPIKGPETEINISEIRANLLAKSDHNKRI